jgi:chromosome partitioning protein
MAKIITFGISKGGCSKTTSSAITAYLLSQNEKVLAIDMDGQGNLTSILTGEYDICNVFEERTVLEAILEGKAEPYIVNVYRNLDLLPSNDFLATLSRKMYENNLKLNALEIALESVMNHYDWIIIDTPPALSEQTLMPLSTRSPEGSFAVIMFDGSMLTYYAIPKFMEIIEETRERFNSNLQTLGILFNLIDAKAKENEAMQKVIDQDYPNLRFNSIIRRRATTRRLAINGLNQENKELHNALELYIPFVKEMKERVQRNNK